LILDIFLYLVLAWYCDNVVPSEYGTTLPWNFPVTKAYWKSFFDEYDAPSETALLNAEDSRSPYADQIEAVTEELAQRDGIHIQQLRKEFPHQDGEDVPPFVAVRNLNLNFYQGQTFVLLGHNGAGKTTTLNMLTGMCNPSSGTATVFGKDIRTQMPEVRKMFGVCPQHDILFPTLSVEQHLILFAQLKGVPAGPELDIMVA